MAMPMGMPAAMITSESGVMGVLSSLGGNKFFVAFLMILMNLSGRYLDFEMLPFQKEFLQSSMIRRIVIFAVAFMATRDVFAALIVASLFIIIVFHLCNTRSPYCVLPEWYRRLDIDGDGVVSLEELKQLHKLSDYQPHVMSA
jgi:hypothetical protein